MVLLTALIGIFSAPAFCADGRRLLDNLYVSQGKLPINDLVADIETYTPIDKADGSSSLSLASKDKLIFKKPNKLKIDSIISDPGGSLDGKQMTIIRDGVNCWLYVSAGQYPVKKKPDEPSSTLDLPPHIQVYPQDADNVVTITGKETIDKTPVTVVKISDKSGSESTTVWIDTKRWVPVKQEKVMTDAKSKGKVTKVVNYKDFRQLKDGRWFPFTFEIQIDGKTNRVVVYKAISVNVGVDDNIFEPMKKFVK